MTKPLDKEVTLTFRIPEGTRRALMSKLSANGIKMNWLMQQAVNAYLGTGHPTSTVSDEVLIPAKGRAGILDLKRQLLAARDSIDALLASVEHQGVTLGEANHDASADHLQAAEHELSAAEQAGPTRGSAGAGGKGRKRVG